MRENAGEMQTRITSNTDTFYAVENCQVKLSIIKFLTESTSSSWLGIELKSYLQLRNKIRLMFMYVNSDADVGLPNGQ